MITIICKKNHSTLNAISGSGSFFNVIPVASPYIVQIYGYSSTILYLISSLDVYFLSVRVYCIRLVCFTGYKSRQSAHQEFWHFLRARIQINKFHFVNAPSPSETTLQCKVVSHRLSAFIIWSPNKEWNNVPITHVHNWVSCVLPNQHIGSKTKWLPFYNYFVTFKIYSFDSNCIDMCFHRFT